jgi:hypothetical protein
MKSWKAVFRIEANFNRKYGTTEEKNVYHQIGWPVGYPQTFQDNFRKSASERSRKVTRFCCLSTQGGCAHPGD